MSIKKNNSKLLIIGMFGSFLSILADVFLGYFPGNVYGSDILFTISIYKFYAVLNQTNHTRLILSTYLSVLGLSLCWFGLYYFYLQLRKSNQIVLSKIILIIGTIGCISGINFHVSLSYTSTLFRICKNQGANNKYSTSELFMFFKDFSAPFAYIFQFSIIILSILLIYIIFLRKTFLPRWSVIFTPFSIVIIINIICLFIPGALKTFLIITIYNISIFFFYLVCFLFRNNQTNKVIKQI